MTMYADILIVDNAENMALKEHHNGKSLSQMDLMRTNVQDSEGLHNPMSYQD